MSIKTKAHSFIKEFKLNPSKIFSLRELAKIAELLNFKIYRPSSEDDIVLNKLNIDKDFRKKSAFSYAKGEIRYVFIYSKISDEAVATLLLHELAHIYLKHLEKSTIPTESDEIEADLFVSCIFKEFHNKRIRFTALNSFICVLTAIMLVVSVHNSRENETIAEVDTTISAITSVTNSEQEENSEIVVITKSGKKYHKPNCYHVIGSEVIELTISEAEAAGYEPCKDCF